MYIVLAKARAARTLWRDYTDPNAKIGSPIPSPTQILGICANLLRFERDLNATHFFTRNGKLERKYNPLAPAFIEWLKTAQPSVSVRIDIDSCEANKDSFHQRLTRRNLYKDPNEDTYCQIPHSFFDNMFYEFAIAFDCKDHANELLVAFARQNPLSPLRAGLTDCTLEIYDAKIIEKLPESNWAYVDTEATKDFHIPYSIYELEYWGRKEHKAVNGFRLYWLANYNNSEPIGQDLALVRPYTT